MITKETDEIECMVGALRKELETDVMEKHEKNLSSPAINKMPRSTKRKQYRDISTWLRQSPGHSVTALNTEPITFDCGWEKSKISYMVV